MDKLKKLKALGRKRKRSRWPGYKCVGDYHGGRYDCAFVSPYAKTAGNFNSQIMVLLQDWSSDKALGGSFHDDCAKYGYGINLPSNKNLIRLLQHYYQRSLSDVWGTNVFPFIKMGSLSSRIPRDHLRRGAVEFALPEIKIVHPRLVICFGLATFNALRAACGLEPVYPVAAAIRNPFTLQVGGHRSGGVRIWCQAHPGRLGQNMRNRGGRTRVPADWKRMRDDVRITG
jgi:hypothetical protein